MPTKVDWTEILLDYLTNGLSNADVAEKYDLDPGYVRIRIKKAKECGELKGIRDLKEARDTLIANNCEASTLAEPDDSNVAVIEEEEDYPTEDIPTAPDAPPVVPPFTPDTRISTGLTPEREREIRQLINSPKDIMIQQQVKTEIERRIKQHEKNGKKDAAFRIAMHQQMKKERMRRLGITYKELLQMKGVRI